MKENVDKKKKNEKRWESDKGDKEYCNLIVWWNVWENIDNYILFSLYIIKNKNEIYIKYNVKF